MGHPSTTSGVADQCPDAISSNVGIFSCARSSPLIPPGMRRAAPHCQVPGRPCVPHAVRNGRTPPIMSHTFAEALTDADRAQADHMADLMLSTALEVLQAAHKTAIGILGDASDLCTKTGRDLPPKASELYAYLLPRQVVSR